MQLTIFGSGYVGLVTGACFADAGNTVTCVDINQGLVDRLNAGQVHIFEPGLSEMISRNRQAKRIFFTTDANKAVEQADIIFIAVGTPPKPDGSTEMQYVDQVATAIGASMNGPKLVVDKSTVPVGTADRVAKTIAAELARRGVSHAFDVVSNPEFLKEGAAIDDFNKPDRIIVGSNSPSSTEMMEELYAPFNRRENRLVVMDVRSAEFTKYAANAMLASRISFMNELANLAERMGIDIEHVRSGIGSDTRIGDRFIYPGCGYGGSCFPKDVQSLMSEAERHDYSPVMLNAIESVNHRQKYVLFNKVANYFGADQLAGKTFAVWGLAFKPNTDDIREAPSIVLMEELWKAGAKVRAFDPEAMANIERQYADRIASQELTLCASEGDTLEGAEALIVCTEWREFRAFDPRDIKRGLKNPVIFDGRNIYDPARMKSHGFEYFGIGRGQNKALSA